MVPYTEIDRKSREQLDNDHQRFKRNFQFKRDQSQKGKNRKGAWKTQTMQGVRGEKKL